MENDIETQSIKPLTQLIDWFEESETQSAPNRRAMDRDFDYYDGNQISAEQEAALRKRKQPVIVSNKIAPSINYLAGIEKQQRVDPVSKSRTPNGEDAAYAATEALRYVTDNANYDTIRSHVWKEMLKVGLGCAKVGVKPKGGEYEVDIEGFSYDRFFADNHSAKPDFSDARFMGIVIWSDREVAIEKYGEDSRSAFDLTVASNGSNYDIFNDKPDMWADKQRDRVRIVEMYYLSGGVWHEGIFTKGGEIFNRVSPFLDADGEPECPIIAQSAYVDRKNNRYGEIRNMIDMQDDYNKRHSKATHIMNSRQVIADKGAVDNPEKARRLLAQPDAFIEKNPGFDLNIESNKGLESGQFQLMQEAERQLDRNDLKTAMVGTSSQSGIAKQQQQQAAFVEVGDLLDNLRSFDTRVFRAIWGRIKQTWTGPRWVDVTDDEGNLQFMPLNVPATDPQTGEQVVQNPVSEIDVDFTIEDAPDVVSLAAEEFQTFTNLLPTLIQAPPQWAKLSLELAPNFRNKKAAMKMVDDMIKGQEQPQPDPMAEHMKHLAVAKEAAQVDEIQSKTALNKSNAAVKQTEARIVPFKAAHEVAKSQAEMMEPQQPVYR